MIRLAQTRRFRARWTDAIQREWMTALLRNRPELDEAKLSRTMTLMNQAVPDCLITGYEHLLAAAICGGAQAIVTTNIKDFPEQTLAEFEILPRHPDDFILDLADLEPAVVATAAKLQRAALKHPSLSPEAFISKLRQQGLPGVAAFLQSQIELIRDWISGPRLDSPTTGYHERTGCLGSAAG